MIRSQRRSRRRCSPPRNNHAPSLGRYDAHRALHCAAQKLQYVYKCTLASVSGAAQRREGIAVSRLRQELDSDVAFTVGVIVLGLVPMAFVMAMIFLS